MPKSYQVAGALLEELIMLALESGGYQSLLDPTGDPTIDATATPFTLHGRGTDHQIDAVADPIFSQPFSNPIRLLVEAKAYNAQRPVDLRIVRNALGTIQDLDQFWTGRNDHPRYSYRYAIFSTSDFTRDAQLYA